MNFFGHAAIAAKRRREPEFVLGSMLPDFESMSGQRFDIHHFDHEQELAAGVRFHHETDAAFHGARPFVELCATGLRWMTDHDVRRGTARAVAHVGVELFIDGALTNDASHCDMYMAAIESASRLWPETNPRHPAHTLFERLRHWGPPHDYQDPDFVLERLQKMLAGRPRLEIHVTDAKKVGQTLPPLQKAVQHRLPELLATVANALGLE